jgi:hypothetical protein
MKELATLAGYIKILLERGLAVISLRLATSFFQILLMKPLGLRSQLQLPPVTLGALSPRYILVVG